MERYSRREALNTMVAGGTGLAISGIPDVVVRKPMGNEDQAGQEALQASQPASKSMAFSGRHQPKPLPFDPARLKGISEKLIRSHWENNYGGAVKALNAVERRLDILLREKDLPAFVYGDLKREELVRTGSVALHELYFANLGGDGKAVGKALDLVRRWFGSYEEWEAEFKLTAAALSGGSGWVVLAYNLQTRAVHNYWAWDHMHNPPMSYPLLVLDMYEHSYQLDYGSAAGRYVDAFMLNIRWDEVDRRLEAALPGKSSLGEPKAT
ncbi:MAG: superoxide dismutase [Acidobacteria bacterium]|nr:superoxide dismutase [Acidobacteriota bacterium]